ncbi:MAG: FtsX-like permease family protein, partial [Actinomycetota bacterium]
MRITLTWLRIDARRRWASLVILGLLLALATTTVLSAVAGARRGDTAASRLLARTLPATVAMLPNQPGFDWARIRQLPEVESLTTFAVAGYVIDGYPIAGQGVGFPPADNDIMRTIERPVVLQGRIYDPRRADEAVVTSLFPAAHGKSVGDTITLDLPTPGQIDQGWDPEPGAPAKGPHVRVRIVGVVRSPWFSDAIRSSGGIVPSPALFTRYRVNFMGAANQNFINALVRLKAGAAGIPAFRADLARTTGRSDIDLLNNLVDFDGTFLRITAFEAACLLAFGLAALVAALFLLGQAVARYTSATVAELQLLRTPGITPRQAIAAACAGPFLAALAGTTLGVAGAIAVSRWMPIGAAALYEPSPGVDADWLVLGTGWVLAPLAVLAGSAVAAQLVLAAGRSSRPARRSALAFRFARAGLPVPAVVGTRFALESGRGRSAVPVRPALAGAVAGVLGVLATFTFTAGISDASANPARFGQTHQLEEFLGYNQIKIAPVSGLRAVARDRDVTGVNDARINVAYAGATSVTMYTYSPVGAKPLPVVLTSGRMPATATQVALAVGTAQQLGASVGSAIRLTGGTHPRTVTVTGIGFVPEGSHNGYASGGWVTPAGYDQVFRGARIPYKFRIAEVAVRPGADLAAVTRRLGRPGQFMPPQLPSQITEIRDVAVLPVVLSGFLVLLAAGAVGHALATAVRRRRHELAVLRALGLTRRQARLVIVTQATVLALAGLAAGIPLGLVLGR